MAKKITQAEKDAPTRRGPGSAGTLATLAEMHDYWEDLEKDLPAEKRVYDRNCAIVMSFAGQMHNLGFTLMGERITEMLESGVWQEWKDGLGHVQLLPGEFDYFLSMCGVEPKDVDGLNADVRAALDARMDETRVTRPGEEPNGYRRRYLDVMAAVGRRTAEPWVLTKAEKSDLKADAEAAERLGESDLVRVLSVPDREPMGARVRRRRTTGETRNPNEKRSVAEQLAVKVAALSFGEYRAFLAALEAERERRDNARCEECGDRLDTPRRFCDEKCTDRAFRARKRAATNGSAKAKAATRGRKRAAT